MNFFIVTSFLLACLVTAQDNGQGYTTLFLPNGTLVAGDYVASVINAEHDTTTYSIGCLPAAADSCDEMTFTIIESPSSADFNLVIGDSSLYYLTMGCDITSTASQAICSGNEEGSMVDDVSGPFTETVTGDDYASASAVITVTSGDETSASASDTASATTPASAAASVTAITASATATATASDTAHLSSSTSGVSSIGTLSTSSVKSSGTDTSASVVSTEAAHSTSKSPSSVSKGGIAQVTGNAPWAVGGAVLAMALVAL